ncbi:uncharacterized protein NECHADRAFT_82300 [Fusarium vanettenii 77-13-4]|uniref:NAD(P)-binding domain-containing protein n=1 Tax=Fusarium vanettenii (strain ATCC MYA-4622 / CBS 123669 / FGSC 9596 / NRRL 45880 / 77-13-4) TaxID=660122 RepID=C7ZQ43_FUSV7|nr:uncharacterized protein NECHADRAFT_82300 [Fusarium vanettenii 77-13-4]EEU33864.1 hypothetical protein NECHADRAFT_82300 [Fusarium vanettenii 77-13-4]
MTVTKVGVTGVTGMTGSHVAVELLNRGHQVIGISRNPTKLGHHERYEPRAVDLDATPIEEIAKILESLDVVIAEKDGRGTAETRMITEAVHGMFDLNGPIVEFHRGGRLTAMFFHGNASFNWTFMSTPALYRPGKRTGSYEVCFDFMPLKPAKGNESGIALFDGRMHGISLSGMALAVAEEVESQKHLWKHWCPYVPELDDTPGPVYVKIGHQFVGAGFGEVASYQRWRWKTHKHIGSGKVPIIEKTACGLDKIFTTDTMRLGGEREHRHEETAGIVMVLRP